MNFLLVVMVVRQTSGIFADQGDQNGRIFANLVIVLLWAVFEKYRRSLNFWLHLPMVKNYVLILTKYRFGYILGDFYGSSSGHPVADSGIAV
jgi:hypothetical protein